jgi:hypothetical protein
VSRGENPGQIYKELTSDIPRPGVGVWGEKIQDRYKELISDISRPGVGVWGRKSRTDIKN